MAWHRLAGIALLAAGALSACAAAPATNPAEVVELKILAINDFHGHLKPPPGGFRTSDAANPGKSIALPAGGAEAMTSAVKSLKASSPNVVMVAAGDLVGASPLLSALFHDEPTIEAMNLMGLDLSAVGNHEFDEGAAELLRLQRGGCHPKDGCKGPAPFKGARFQYLAASTVDTATGKTLLPPYAIKRFGGVPVGFIGLTLKATPRIVTPAGVAGLAFKDEAETVNALVPELKRQGVATIVVLIHEGGEPTGGYDECPGISGPIVDIVHRLDPAVGVVVSGHTHEAYICRIDGRLVTSAHRFGTLLTEIDLKLDGRSGALLDSRATNHILRHDRYAKDPAQTALIAGYEKVAAPLAQRVVGRLPQAYTAAPDEAGESALGRLVADAQLAATAAADRGGARIAFTNPGGLRSPLHPGPGGVVRYEDVFASQPFSNELVTMTLTGAELKELLERQFGEHVSAEPRLLQVSRGFSYAWDARRARGDRVVPGSLKLDGHAIEPGESLRITVNSYLAGGGDGHRLFTEGRARLVGEMDVDALARYLNAGPAPVDQPRITRVSP
jgi:5'-nucleotidase